MPQQSGDGRFSAPPEAQMVLWGGAWIALPIQVRLEKAFGDEPSAEIRASLAGGTYRTAGALPPELRIAGA